MKLKLKTLAAAAVLAASAPAFASISGPDDGSAQLFLTVWQQSGYAGGTFSGSYTIDLLTTYDQFLAGKDTNLFVNQVINDSYFSQLLAAAGDNTANLQFSVLVGDRVDAGVVVDRMISTYAGSNQKPDSTTNLGLALDAISNFTGSLNATGSFAINAGNPALGGASYNISGAEYYQNNAFGGGMNVLYGSSTVNSGLLGSNLAVTQSTRDGFDNPPTKTVLPGTFYFGQQAGNYVLQYQVAAVPEPTGIALALAGFGIVGFIGRRRSPR